MKVRVTAHELFPVYEASFRQAYGTLIEVPEDFWGEYTETREKFEVLCDRLEVIVSLFRKQAAKTVLSASQDITESSGKPELFRKLSADTSST